MKLGGTISMGEYVSALKELFSRESRAEFQAVDTDTLRGRRTIIYEFEVKKEFSKQSLGVGRRWMRSSNKQFLVIVAASGSIAKNSRVLRLRRHQHRNRCGISHHRGQQSNRLRLGDH